MTSKFNENVNEILREATFGNQYERMTGIKKQVVLQQESDSNSSPVAKKLVNSFNTVKSYGMGDRSGNVKAQSEYDEIVVKLLGDMQLQKVDINNDNENKDEWDRFFKPSNDKSQPTFVYTALNQDVMNPLGILAHSEEDLGSVTKLAPLSQWAIVDGNPGIIIGYKKSEDLKPGRFGEVPVLIDRGGENGRIYTGPAADVKPEEVLKESTPSLSDFTSKPKPDENWNDLTDGVNS